MIYKRGKQGTYWYRFRFAGRMIHESAKTQSKTLARDGERQRRRELEEKWNRVERRSLPPTFERASSDWLVESSTEDFVFPACEAAGIERQHPDLERIDPAQPIKSWRSAWRAALKRAGLQFRFHDLRHTCITKLAESQASEQTLMAISGHVSRRMIEHYSHIRMDAKRRATDAIVEGGVHQNVHQVQEVNSSTAAKSLN